MQRRLKGTQRQWVEKALLSGKSLKHTDLIKACGGTGGWRLGAVIHELATDNWPIQRRYEAGRRVATYWLPAGFKPGEPFQLVLPL